MIEINDAFQKRWLEVHSGFLEVEEPVHPRTRTERTLRYVEVREFYSLLMDTERRKSFDAGHSVLRGMSIMAEVLLHPE